MVFLQGPVHSPTRPPKNLLFSLPNSTENRPLTVRDSHRLPGQFDDTCVTGTGSCAADEQTVTPGDSDGRFVHQILLNHFGFIPYDPSLDGEGYKLRSPTPSTSFLSRDPLLFSPDHHHHRRSRTSSTPDPFSLPSMTKKRRSLTSILVPPFMPQVSPSTSASASSSTPSLTSSTSRTRSHTVTSTSSVVTSASSNDLSVIDNSTDWLSFYSGATSPSSEYSSFGPVTPSRNSPPPDLLDEDPFANLSPAPSLRASRTTSPVRSVFDVFTEDLQRIPPTPLSPLAQSALEQDGGDDARRARSLRGIPSSKSLRDLPSTPPSSPIEPTRPRLARRPKSSGPPQVRPAYTRPAFAPRPSLPSLNTLASTSIHVPKVRRGRPGAQLPIEPWEDPGSAGSTALSAPPSPTYARNFSMSPVARRRHLRRPTLSIIRDSRMYSDGDGENAGDGGIPPLETPTTKEPSSLAGASSSVHDAESEGEPIRGASAVSSASISLQPQMERRNAVFDDPDDQDKPPTPPPKSPSLVLHSRSTSGTSTASTVPSLCFSSPTSSSFASVEPSLNSHSPPRAQSLLPPLPRSHPHMHVDADHSVHPGYSELFAHHRNTQLFASDLMATLEYDYSEAISHLGTPGRTPLPPSALYPSGDFEPGSSEGTIKNVVLTRVQFQGSDESSTQEGSMHRVPSDSSGESQWSTEANDIHGHGQSGLLKVPLSPLSPAELQTSSSEDLSTEDSACPSPLLCLSRSSRSSSTVSSEYDFGEDEDGYYSYDVGSFRDPFGTPSTAQQRPVFGYGIPWPSTHRTSGSSGGSGGSSGSMNDVLSDLEDLAEDLTERFALSMRSSDDSVRSSSYCGPEDVFGEGALADAPEGGYSSRRSRRPSGGSGGHGQSAAGSSSNGHSGSGSGYSGGRNGYGGYRRRGGDDDDSDDDRRRRPARLPVSAHVAAPESESESEDSGTDDYGEDSPSVNRTRKRHDTTRPGMHSPLPLTSPSAADMTDDDVPLARHIPGALRAQKTIRRQVRDELDQKRAERRAQRTEEALRQQQQQQGEQRSTRTMSSAAASTAPIQQSSPSKSLGRPRTKTLPSNMNSPFSAGDLTKRLLVLQTSSSPTSPALPPVPVPVAGSPLAPCSKRPSIDGYEPLARGRSMRSDGQTYAASASRASSRPPAQDPGRTLRLMRSFHRTRGGEDDLAPPLPISDRSSQPKRSMTSASRRRPLAEDHSSTLDRARSVKSESSRRPSMEHTPPPPPPPPPIPVSPRPAVNEGFVVISRARSATTTSGPGASAVPASTVSQPGKAPGQMWQQRVFIGNMQRFCLVEIGSGTSAGDVLNMVDGQGALDQGAGSGGWMLWEVSQDFGMERPIRNFEILNDVCGAWNSDKTVNLLVIKKTLLAPLLSSKAVPLSSPMCSGYVQWEHKRGKWQKRWMELREHSLWLSKRDTGKDATFLCSLNNFDAFYVTRVHKAPKPYVFSVKSTDSLTYFENTSDYVHVFSCGESEGKNWLEKILLARSYVLFQERNVVSTTAGSTTLQRMGTRKRPAQPLVVVGASKSEMVAPNAFEPAAGSLLARR